jgi:hypothetical protein
MKPEAVVSNVIRLEPPLERTQADAGRYTVALDEGREVRLDPGDRRAASYVEALDGLRKLRHPVYLEIDPTTSIIARLLIPIIARVVELRTTDSGLDVELAPSHARHALPASSATSHPRGSASWCATHRRADTRHGD